ncbi:MAG: serine hydrolase domain-containing protein [Hyphomicrobiaceae bacterium]
MFGARLPYVLVPAVALVSAAVCPLPAWPQELSTKWEVPPGDPTEHMAAGFAKILCSAVFVTGRDLAAAVEEDGYFVAPRVERGTVAKTAVDKQGQAVHVTLPNGVIRTARFYGDQGCVTLPLGKDKGFFTPVQVRSELPDAAMQLWPMGDPLSDIPLPSEIDKAKLQASVAAAFDPPEALTAAFLVAYKGRLVAERYRQGFDYTTRLPGWSMGKSLTATLIGRLVHEGVYDLWAPAPVPEWQRPDDPRRAIRIADLLRMSSGLRFVAPQDPDFDPSRGYPDHVYVYTGAIDAFRWSMTRPLQWLPNTQGRYRNSDPLILNFLVKQAAIARGQEYLSYPQRLLFDKIGIRRMVLEPDPYGNFLLQGYELGPGRDWLRLGLLYLQDGVWNGERLLPEGWVDFVRTPAPAWTEPVYGGMFWLNGARHWPIPGDAYYMAGSGGQYTFIVPTHDLVVVRLGHDKGAAAGHGALARALRFLMQAVPARRP